MSDIIVMVQNRNGPAGANDRWMRGDAIYCFLPEDFDKVGSGSKKNFSFVQVSSQMHHDTLKWMASQGDAFPRLPYEWPGTDSEGRSLGRSKVKFELDRDGGPSEVARSNDRSRASEVLRNIGLTRKSEFGG